MVIATNAFFKVEQKNFYIYVKGRDIDNNANEITLSFLLSLIFYF